ncbi:uncharacterized protein [Thunnus thynnus]|uniref:uncharacterized protein n=1 Tax=Thunnus thynnus TaxID=8237 RepID=UPI0035275483
MTHPTDDIINPQPESGRALHTQESGDAGLSSNMRHKFSDKSALPIEIKGSSVIPIPTSELREIFESPEMVGKIRQHPSVFGPVGVLSMMRHTEPEAYPAAAEGDFLKLSTLVQKSNFPPQATPQALTVSTLPGTTAITDAEEVVGGEQSCTSKMDTEGNQAKPKGSPLVPREGRNKNRRRKRAATKKWKWCLLGWMTFINIRACGGNAGAQPAADQESVKCFSCMDKDTCPKLVNIYETADTHLYQRRLNQPFPGCSGIPAPSSKSCAVCYVESSIAIICSGDVGRLEVEDSDGGHIVNTHAVSCSIMENSPIESKQKQQTSNLGLLTVLIGGCILFVQWRPR